MLDRQAERGCVDLSIHNKRVRWLVCLNPPPKHPQQADPKRLIILVRKETTADDIHGMRSAAGILTENGGMTSHAAVVARGMGKCCVTGELRKR